MWGAAALRFEPHTLSHSRQATLSAWLHKIQKMVVNEVQSIECSRYSFLQSFSNTVVEYFNSRAIDQAVIKLDV